MKEAFLQRAKTADQHQQAYIKMKARAEAAELWQLHYAASNDEAIRQLEAAEAKLEKIVGPWRSWSRPRMVDYIVALNHDSHMSSAAVTIKAICDYLERQEECPDKLEPCDCTCGSKHT